MLVPVVKGSPNQVEGSKLSLIVETASTLETEIRRKRGVESEKMLNRRLLVSSSLYSHLRACTTSIRRS